MADARKPTASCDTCHRPLTDPVSVKAERGPVCREKTGMDEPHAPRFVGSTNRCATRADWTFIVEDDVVIVEDLDAGRCSVTNDAEGVVLALAREVPLGGRRIVYRDSERTYDELLHDGRRFVGFRPLGATSRSDAVARARGEVAHG